MKKVFIFVITLAVLIFPPSLARAADWKTLQPGAASREAYALKLLLIDRNFKPGELNPVFDPKTVKALVSFQEQNGLAANGETDPETWEKLVSEVYMTEQPIENCAVKAAQYLLRNKYSFSSIKANGVFDFGTKAAVLLFQRNYGLGVNGMNGMDGAVGLDTWSYLISDSRKEDNYGWAICIEFNKDRGRLGTLYAYDQSGRELLEIPCLGQSMTMNDDWRSEYGNTPLGSFRAFISYKWRNRQEYGRYYCVELNDADVRAVTDGRGRILIHSGSNQYKQRPDYELPHMYKDFRAKNIQGLDQTHGCVRISDADHKRLYNCLKGKTKGIVSISENIFE